MYTLLIGKDNMLVTTNAERIVQRSKGANTIEILVDNEYNGVKMNECLAVLFYRLPVSGTWHPMELTPSDELYLDKYVTYQFSADTWLTAERGDVQLEMKFFNVELLDGVNVDQYVRKVTDGVIHISSSEDWGSGIADSLRHNNQGVDTERFNNILRDCDDYERIIHDNDMKNGFAEESMKFIKTKYQEMLNN